MKTFTMAGMTYRKVGTMLFFTWGPLSIYWGSHQRRFELAWGSYMLADTRKLPRAEV